MQNTVLKSNQNKSKKIKREEDFKQKQGNEKCPKWRVMQLNG